MVLIKELRIVMPLSVDEYRIGQLYSVAMMSKNETGGGDGVEVLRNEPFTGQPLFDGKYSEGQYTKKRCIGKKKVSGFVRKLFPASALVGTEEAWNAYPYCRTIVTNEYMGEDFSISIESLHLPGRGEYENVHKLPPDVLEQREVILIDIAEALADKKDYKKDEDHALYYSKKANRGPLNHGWMHDAQPCMTCYKLVTAKFKWFGLQTMLESKILQVEKRLFTLFHRKVFCLLDEWYGLTIEDIRKLETQTKADLEVVIQDSNVRGLRAED